MRRWAVFSRRSVVGGLVLGAVRAAASERLTFVLVPGAWHGGWAFSRVAPLLEREGHVVEAVSLPGLAERRSELDASIGLDRHVEDVADRVRRARGAVVLVGHSYAGMVVTPVAAALSERVARLVYLDAFIPRPGQSMLAAMRQQFSESWRSRARAVSKGLWVPPMLDARAMGVTDPQDVAWVNAQLTPHPMRTLEEGAMFDAQRLARVPRRYVWCSRYPGFKRYADEASALGWEVRRLEAGHDAMLTHPLETAEALL